MRHYLGSHDGPSGSAVVEVRDDKEFKGLLVHHVKHSPTGMSWGYAGSGPADTARSLLIDHLGDAAWCKTCGGTGKVPAFDVLDWESTTATGKVPASEVVDRRSTTDASGAGWELDTCGTCWGDKTAFSPALYQAFKFDIVAGLGSWWHLTEADIGRWLATQHEAIAASAGPHAGEEAG